MKKLLQTLSLALILAMALCLAACTPAEMPNTDRNTNSAGSHVVSNAENSNVENKITITVNVVGSNGETTPFTIETSCEMLRGALEQENLVQGEDGAYGLYIKTVNGETADYDVNGAYWAVYIGEEMAMTGVDQIELTDGATYKLVYTK